MLFAESCREQLCKRGGSMWEEPDLQQVDRERTQPRLTVSSVGYSLVCNLISPDVIRFDAQWL